MYTTKNKTVFLGGPTPAEALPMGHQTPTGEWHEVPTAHTVNGILITIAIRIATG